MLPDPGFPPDHRPRPDMYRPDPGPLRRLPTKPAAGGPGGFPPAQEEEFKGTAFLPLLGRRRTPLTRQADPPYSAGGPPLRSGFLACSGRPPSPAPFWFRFRLHVQNARLGSAPAADPGNVLASVHRLKGQDVPSGGILAGEQPGRSRGAAVSRSGRST